MCGRHARVGAVRRAVCRRGVGAGWPPSRGHGPWAGGDIPGSSVARSVLGSPPGSRWSPPTSLPTCRQAHWAGPADCRSRLQRLLRWVCSPPLFWFSAAFQLHPYPGMTRSPAHPQGLRHVPLSPPSQHWHGALSSLIGSAGSVRSCVISSRTPYGALEVAESQSPALAPRQ